MTLFILFCSTNVLKTLHSVTDDHHFIPNLLNCACFPAVKEKHRNALGWNDSGLQVPSLDRSDAVLLLCFFSPQICSSVHRQQLLVALMMHLSQQFSGINAVSGRRSGLRPPRPGAVLDP